jgi:release factor glutamine methyltransferase
MASAELRRRRVPLQQILGRTEFYSLPFRITPHVLVPRPETEILVEALVDRLCSIRRPRILDVGTGSGAIAVSVAHAMAESRVTALDISADALAVAGDNARLNGVDARVTLLCGSLLAPLLYRPTFDAISANLPYIPSDQFSELQPEVRDHEPRLALDGGPGGLRLYPPLVARAADLLGPGGWLAMEVGDGQAQSVARMVASNPALAPPEILPDLNGTQRVLLSRARI